MNYLKCQLFRFSICTSHKILCEIYIYIKCVYAIIYRLRVATFQSVFVFDNKT